MVDIEQQRHNVSTTHRSGACRQSAVGQVGAANVSEVWEHEEGIADIWGGLEKSTILPSPENCETESEWNFVFIHSFNYFIPLGSRKHLSGAALQFDIFFKKRSTKGLTPATGILLHQQPPKAVYLWHIN